MINQRFWWNYGRLLCSNLTSKDSVFWAVCKSLHTHELWFNYFWNWNSKCENEHCISYPTSSTCTVCQNVSSPRQHPSSSKWSFLLTLPQHPASFSRTWLLFALQGTKSLLHTLCLSSTGNVLHIARQVIKLKIWVGPSPTEHWNFFTQRANIK